MNIMGSIRIYKGMPPLTDEQIQRIRANAPKSDDEIDYSDIPETTEEELKKFKPARLRRKKLNLASWRICDGKKFSRRYFFCSKIL